jgi:hypothetical protein
MIGSPHHAPTSAARRPLRASFVRAWRGRRCLARRSAKARSLIGLCALVVGVTACTAPRGAHVRATTAHPPRAPLFQLDYWAREVELGRQALGLPVRALEPSASTSVGGATGGKEPARMGGGASASRPMGPSLAPSEGPEEMGRKAQLESRYRRPITRCDHVRAICHAARKICEIAAQLGDESSRARCTRARADCDAAKDMTRGEC